MMISNLEHLEIISQQIGSETPKKVSGGALAIRARSFGAASGSIAAITSQRTQTVTVTYPLRVLLTFP